MHVWRENIYRRPLRITYVAGSSFFHFFPSLFYFVYFMSNFYNLHSTHTSIDLFFFFFFFFFFFCICICICICIDATLTAIYMHLSSSHTICFPLLLNFICISISVLILSFFNIKIVWNHFYMNYYSRLYVLYWGFWYMRICW